MSHLSSAVIPIAASNESLLKVISMMPKFKALVLDVKATMGAKTDREIVAAAFAAGCYEGYVGLCRPVSRGYVGCSGRKGD